MCFVAWVGRVHARGGCVIFRIVSNNTQGLSNITQGLSNITFA